ncbi:EpsG family protein [Raineyella antarctica]|uniref:EpsG family protein n=1 Tax=Raineyella antarctica TaxID=1577474 RepID=A0A1G6GEK4_9ACTN|nr:EpsG family protein [Raineyella antarctica]SDB80394.1 EpsG family protein [Raineyella antarctica]
MLAISLLIIFLGLARVITLPLRPGKLVFGALAACAMWVVIAFRDLGFGSDTAVYIANYKALQCVSFADVAARLLDPSVKDPAFYLLAKIFSELGVGPRAWIAVLAAIFCISLGRAVHKYSPEPFLSFIATISLGLTYFAMNGLRQTLAMSVLLWAYGALRERRPVRFILIVALASAFHSAALIFLVAYPLAGLVLGWRQVILVMLGWAGAFLAPDRVRQMITEFAWTESLKEYADSRVSLSVSGLIIAVSILLFCVALRARVLKQDPQALSFYNVLAVGAGFQAMATLVAEFFRVAYYFNIAAVFLIPMAVVHGTPRNQRSMIYFGVLGVLLAYTYWASPYSGLTLAR